MDFSKILPILVGSQEWQEQRLMSPLGLIATFTNGDKQYCPCSCLSGKIVIGESLIDIL
jgi:hypothetical protein